MGKLVIPQVLVIALMPKEASRALNSVRSQQRRRE